MGAIGTVIRDWQRRQSFEVSLAQIGRAMRPPVTRSAVQKWVAGESVPDAAHLRALALVLSDVPYWRLLDAMLVDAGYLEERESRGNAAPMTTDGAGGGR